MRIKLPLFFLLLAASGCGGNSRSNTDSDKPTDTETKKDSETASETGIVKDTQTESDTGSSVEKETDSASDTGSPTDTGTGSETETFVDTWTWSTEDSETSSDIVDAGNDTDTENPWLPPGCEIVTSFRGEWGGERNIYKDLMTFGEQDPGIGCQSVMIRRFSTKEVFSVTDCDLKEDLTIWDKYVYWVKTLDTSNSLTREIYRVNIETKKVEQITDNDCADFTVYAGKDNLMYLNTCDEKVIGINIMSLATKDIFTITTDSRGNPSGYDFDGERWAVWIYDDVAYKYDIVNRSGPTIIDSTLDLSTWPKISDNKVYSGSWTKPVDPAKHCDVHIHDLATGKNSWAFTKPYDQIQPSASGNVVAYLTTEELGTGWLSDPAAHVEIYDLETGVSRRVTNLPEVYYAVALHGKYLAWGGGERTLFLCDLEAGGFVNSSGHVLAEGSTPEGGVDAGADAGSKK